MGSVLFTCVILLAVLVWGRRRYLRARLSQLAQRLPGATRESAIPVRTFTEIDAALTQRRCHCGGHLTVEGEGSHEIEGKRYRVVRVECLLCESVGQVHFDVTDIRH